MIITLNRLTIDRMQRESHSFREENYPTSLRRRETASSARTERSSVGR